MLRNKHWADVQAENINNSCISLVVENSKQYLTANKRLKKKKIKLSLGQITNFAGNVRQVCQRHNRLQAEVVIGRELTNGFSAHASKLRGLSKGANRNCQILFRLFWVFFLLVSPSGPYLVCVFWRTGSTNWLSIVFLYFYNSFQSVVLFNIYPIIFILATLSFWCLPSFFFIFLFFLRFL